MSHQTFLDYIRENGIKVEILQSNDSTHTAKEAADYCGCDINQIVKSLLVNYDGHFYLFLVPGGLKLDFEVATKMLIEFDKLISVTDIEGGKMRMATAEEVKSITGYSIGGVPPFGHKQKILTIIYDGFDLEKDVFAAAGSSNTIFKVSFSDLEKIVAA